MIDTRIIDEEIFQLMENSNLFGGGNTIKPYQKLITSALFEYMKEKLGFNAKIVVRGKKVSNLFGDIVISEKAISTNTFTVHVDPNVSVKYLIDTLVHEFVHVKQVSNGELRPNKEFTALVWNNITYPVTEYKKMQRNYSEYIKIPWETEAYKYMNDELFYNEFVNSPHVKKYIGKDPTYDLVVKNL